MIESRHGRVPGVNGPCAGDQRIQVIGIDRVLIATANLDDSVESFEEYLGLSFGDWIDLGHEPAANRTSTIGVKFITGEPGSAVARYVDENGPGLYALALEVADLDAVRDHLAAAGIEPVDETAARSLRELFYHPSAFGGPSRR